jgi:ribonucleoside-diphosphate reductase alpha chain
MDTLATTISVALQYGVPLRDLVNKFAHVRFEPSGFTGNQEIPIAKSLVDYIFRWLGSRFLSTEDNQMLGLQPAAVTDSSASTVPTFGVQSPSPSTPPMEPTTTEAKTIEPKTSEPDVPKGTAITAGPARLGPEPAISFSANTRTQPRGDSEVHTIATNGYAANGNGKSVSNGNGGAAPSILNLGSAKVSFQTQADAPSCADCGSIMIRNGSCYKCLNCGSTSGCS